MRAAIYSFSCKFEKEALLPRFKGSTLRGALGHALKRISCALRRQDCRTCLLVGTCAYAFLFEVDDNEADVPIAHRPHPYVLVPPEDEVRAFSPGHPFSFGAVLFGRANNYLPHLVYAVQEMGREGLGKKQNLEAGRFRLESVSLGREMLYRDGGALTHPTDLPELSLAGQPPPNTNRISVTCRTPLRLKHRNHLQDDLTFELLIRAALRRVSTLEHAYGPDEPDLDYKGLVGRAAGVRMVASECRWIEIERYSNRQRTGMLMGGLQGRLVYQGDGLAEFLPLLRYCETAHLGKQTSFGLGRIEVQSKGSF